MYSVHVLFSSRNFLVSTVREVPINSGVRKEIWPARRDLYPTDPYRAHVLYASLYHAGDGLFLENGFRGRRDSCRRRLNHRPPVARCPGAGQVLERVRSAGRVPDHGARCATVRDGRVRVGRGRAGPVHEDAAQRGRRRGTAGGGGQGPDGRRGTARGQPGGSSAKPVCGVKGGGARETRSTAERAGRFAKNGWPVSESHVHDDQLFFFF